MKQEESSREKNNLTPDDDGVLDPGVLVAGGEEARVLAGVLLGGHADREGRALVRPLVVDGHAHPVVVGDHGAVEHDLGLAAGRGRAVPQHNEIS